MAEQRAQTKMTRDCLASLEQEEAELKTKVQKLEMYLHTNMSIKGLQVTEPPLADNICFWSTRRRCMFEHQPLIC